MWLILRLLMTFSLYLLVACRRRTLVAIGTHDLDTLEGPFTYEVWPRLSFPFRGGRNLADVPVPGCGLATSMQ